MRIIFVCFVVVLAGCLGRSGSLDGGNVIIMKTLQSEFVYEPGQGPTVSCHASTIVETAEGDLVTAWFGGAHEKHQDVGIWLARWEGDGWSEPLEVANGKVGSGRRYPCWNPVLFQPDGGQTILCYKVGPSPSEWWGMLKTSSDGGRTWDEERRLPDGVLGPIKNKPIGLTGGTILCGSSTEDQGWRVHFEWTVDGGGELGAAESSQRWARVRGDPADVVKLPGGSNPGAVPKSSRCGYTDVVE